MNPTPSPEPQETPQPPEAPTTPPTTPAPEPPVDPVTPPVTLPQPAPLQSPKKGISKGALIAIIVGSSIVFVTLVGILVAIILTSYNNISERAKNDSSTSSQSNNTPKASDSIVAYDGTNFSFNYPSDWKINDKSNQTTIIDGTRPDTYTVITSPDSDKSGIVNYTYTKGGTQLVDKDRARAAIKTALQAQLNATQSQLLSFRASSGHGCTANLQYTDQPTLQEKGDLIGYTYGYTCDSLYGPVQGAYGVWYDQYGGQQRLLVSALKPYWQDNSSRLQAILSSATSK